jgi:regulator of cell morphogenesis and NO signaling
MMNSSYGPSLLQHTLAEIVTADSRTAAIFDRLGLDYCCHGHQTLQDAVRASGAPLEPLLADIDRLGPATPQDHSAADWPELDALAAHIVGVHHQYVRDVTPSITRWLEKLASHHGERHPELKEVQAAFASVARDLGSHMVKEENILFPYVHALAVARRNGSRLPSSPFGTIANPIRMMEEEHRRAGDELEGVRRLTSAYTPPADACTTYRLCYEELARFERDLHRHVHLENNILFPRAVDLEHQLA